MEWESKKTLSQSSKDFNARENIEQRAEMRGKANASSLQTAFQRHSKVHNDKRRPVHFKLFDMVTVHPNAYPSAPKVVPRLHDGKFKSKRLGPFVIVDVLPLGNNTVRLQLPPHVILSDLFHVDQIAPFHVRSGEPTGHDRAWICNGGTPDLPTGQIIAKLIDYDHSTPVVILFLTFTSTVVVWIHFPQKSNLFWKYLIRDRDTY
jgi:hypothetical protein